jgi:hypothetical protein
MIIRTQSASTVLPLVTTPVLVHDVPARGVAMNDNGEWVAAGTTTLTSEAVRPDRRVAGRRAPGHPEPLARIRLRTGRDAMVLDVSDAGALVEGGVRLLPGSHVDAHVVTTAGRLLVRSRVVRAWVCSLDATGPTYRTALAFQARVDTAHTA